MISFERFGTAPAGSARFHRLRATALVGLVAATASAPALAQQPELHITEYCYKAVDGEFIELTNTGAQPIDLDGWSIDDIEAIPGAYDLSPAGVVGPGESLVITTGSAQSFRLAWSLQGSPVQVLGDNDTAKLSRADAIVVFDPSGAEVDRLEFGDLIFEYSVRALDISAWVCADALGQDDPYGWRLSIPGDAQGSQSSSSFDVGSPGSHVLTACAPLGIGTLQCAAQPNSTGLPGVLRCYGHPSVAQGDLTLRLTGAPAGATVLAIMGEQATLVPGAGGSQGTLCVGAGLTRLVSLIGVASPQGVWTADLDLANPAAQQLPLVGGGETWRFQAWYRDVNPGPTSNFSTGWTVNFRP